MGKGTEFSIYFPTSGSRRRESSTGNARTILFLDDDAGLVLFARWALNRSGYDVIGYSNADEALGAFAAAPRLYDVVVTDLTMPEVEDRKSVV